MENTNVIEGTVVPNSQLNLAGVLKIPAVRQLILLVGVAASVAAGFAIVLWSQTPSYTQLYGELSATEAADIADALRSSDIDFKLNTSTGGIMVPAASLHDARMQLASQGLPQSVSAGMSALDDQSSFGVSQFMESARYQTALEAELERTIASLGSVRDARIHLALPKQTSFIRDQKSASASVLLHLFSGAALESDQASAIVHLVASSVPNLSPKNVTVVDQHGQMLSSGEQSGVDAQAASEFKYSRRLEATYKQRIEELLMPLVGPGRIRAQVVADVDFTVSEQTRESFDPASTVVRSEQLNEQQRSGDAARAAGVPGATSNQPPQDGGDGGANAAAESAEVLNSSRSTVRNYEVDRTISRTRPTTSSINRLSVAVLVDDSPLATGADGAAPPAGLSDADIERYTALVKEAVGFNETRGDTVVVIGAQFRELAPLEEVEPPPFWEKPMLRDILKQVLGAALVLALAFGLVRPMLKSVVASNGGTEFIAGIPGAALTGPGGAMQAAGVAGSSLPAPNYDEKVAAAKNITGHDPARVAQVVKKWVSVDG